MPNNAWRCVFVLVVLCSRTSNQFEEDAFQSFADIVAVIMVAMQVSLLFPKVCIFYLVNQNLPERSALLPPHWRTLVI